MAEQPSRARGTPWRGGAPRGRGTRPSDRGAPRGRGANTWLRGAAGPSPAASFGRGRGALHTPERQPDLMQDEDELVIELDDDDDTDEEEGPPEEEEEQQQQQLPPPPPPAPKKLVTTTAFAATGEDADARKLRFESSQTHTHNRFLELKPLREAERLKAIQQGLIPDPLKPMRLDEATDFVGICEEFCPEFEREEREYQNNVDVLERYPGTNRINPARAVKAFHRPAAGNDQPLPSDVRPPRVLEATLDYLFREILPAHPLHVTHPFLRDRTRSVRQDFTVQNVRGTSAIECNERIARYHVLALGTLREQSSFSESQELEQLRKVLKSLNEFYDDARKANPPIPTPNEPEFRSYFILTHLRDPDIIWSSEMLPPIVFLDPLFQTALSLHALAQRPNIQRGERASINGFSRFFKLLSSPDVPYLFGCILSTHFPEIRKNGLEALKRSFQPMHGSFPARTLAKILGCDDEEEIKSICMDMGLETDLSESGKLLVKINRNVVFKPNATIKARNSRRIVEAKRGSIPYSDIIDGATYATSGVTAIPPSPSIANAPSFFSQPPTAVPSPPSGATASKSAFSSAFSVKGSATTPVPSGFNNVAANGAAPSPQSSKSVFGSDATTSATLQPPPSSIFSSATPFGTPPTPASIFGPGPTKALPESAPSPSSSLNPAAQSFVPAGFPTSSNVPSSKPAPKFTSSSLPFSPPPPIASNITVPSGTKEATPTFHQSITPASPLPNTSNETPSERRPPTTTLVPTPRKASLLPTPPTVESPARRARVAALSSLIADEVVRDVVERGARRTAELALKERWGVILDTERARRRAFVARVSVALGGELVDGCARRETGLVAWELRREVAWKTRYFERWTVVMRDKVRRRASEIKRRKAFEQVAREIGVGPKEEPDDGRDDDEDTAEMDGILDLSSLSLGEKRLPSKDMNDDLIAARLEKAQRRKSGLWTPGTFLDAICARANKLFRPSPPDKTTKWSTLVSTSARDDPFSSWLVCKFDLMEPDLEATVELRHVEVQVQMIEGVLIPDASLVENVGFLVFDATRPEGSGDDVAFWGDAKTRLHLLLSGLEEYSIFTPSLVILSCPTTLLTPDEEDVLESTILNHLEIPKATKARTAVVVAHPTAAEAQFKTALSSLPFDNAVRPQKAPRPLTTFTSPLLSAWGTAVERVLRRAGTGSSSFLLALAESFLELLGSIVTLANQLAVNSLSAIPSLPSLTSKRDISIRSCISSYIAQPCFKDVFYLPLVNSALSEYPALSDAALLRILLEHLGAFVASCSLQASIRQETLKIFLTKSMQELEVKLEKVERRLVAGTDVKVKDSGTPKALDAGPRKRKASLSPAGTITGSSPKKVFADGGVGRGSLDKLGMLLRDAQALLSNRN